MRSILWMNIWKITVEALEAMSYERLPQETGADNTLNSLDEYMSSHLT